MKIDAAVMIVARVREERRWRVDVSNVEGSTDWLRRRALTWGLGCRKVELDRGEEGTEKRGVWRFVG